MGLTSFTESVRICHGSSSIEFGGGSTEHMETVWTFHCTLFFISISSLLIYIWPGINGVVMGFTSNQWGWSFPIRQIRRKVTIELYRSDVGLMDSYDRVRMMIVSFHVSLSFSSLTLASAAQEVCT